MLLHETTDANDQLRVICITLCRSLMTTDYSRAHNKTSLQTHTCTYTTNTHIHAYTLVYPYADACRHTHTHTNTYKQTHAHMSAHICTHTHVHTHTCLHTRACTHTHAHTHTHTTSSLTGVNCCSPHQSYSSSLYLCTANPPLLLNHLSHNVIVLYL